jgi:circadian clock protein KaiB
MPDEKKMDGKQPPSTTEQFENLVSSGIGRYILRLYVSGATPKSLRAIDNIKRICETELTDRYSLEVIDVYQQPELLAQDQVIAAPTLIRQLPMPIRKLVGDLEDTEHVLKGLDLVKP